MTWIDILLIVFVLISLGVGARMGSIWTGACLAAGFLGAVLVDIYSPSLNGYLSRVPGAGVISLVSLFIGGCALTLIPGWIMSRVCAGLFLGVFDSAIGLLAGALAGFCAVTLFLMSVIPLFPRVEKTAVWKQSSVVRPLHHALEKWLSLPHFRTDSKLKPLTREAESEIKKAASRLLHEIKKN